MVARLTLRAAALAVAIAFLPELAAAQPAPARTSQPAQWFDRISHILVIYMENRSFDNLFGEFPGVEGLARARDPRQSDRQGQVYAVLPPSIGPFDVPDNPPELRA